MGRGQLSFLQMARNRPPERLDIGQVGQRIFVDRIGLGVSFKVGKIVIEIGVFEEEKAQPSLPRMIEGRTSVK